MVDKLTGLIAIFQKPELDFKNNKAEDDDLIGDAYEYLMRNFATASGSIISNYANGALATYGNGRMSRLVMNIIMPTLFFTTGFCIAMSSSN